MAHKARRRPSWKKRFPTPKFNWWLKNNDFIIIEELIANLVDQIKAAEDERILMNLKRLK